MGGDASDGLNRVVRRRLIEIGADFFAENFWIVRIEASGDGGMANGRFLREASSV
jgi:hypothetical protein